MLTFADSTSWHLEMSSDSVSISLASATIQRCDDILNAQFDSMDADLAHSVPFSDEMQATDLLFSSGSITTQKSVGASVQSAPAAADSIVQTTPMTKSLPISVAAAAYSSVVPVSTAKAAAAAVQPTSRNAGRFELPVGDSESTEEEPDVDADHEDRVSACAPGSRAALASAPAAAPAAKFLLHAPAAWYDDVPAAAQDSIALTAAAQAKQDDGFTPVVSKRRARATAAAASPSPTHQARTTQKHRSSAKKSKHAPVSQQSTDESGSAALRQRARDELVLSPSAGGTAKRLTAQVAKVVDEHTVLVRFTGDFKWVKTVGVVSLQSTKRVVPGAHVQVTATDVKQRTAQLAQDVPLSWFLQCSAVPVQPLRSAAALPAAVSQASPAAQHSTAVAPRAAAPDAAGSSGTHTTPTTSTLPSTAPSAASAANSSAAAGKKRRVFNVNAAEFVPGIAAPPLLNPGMQARMLPFAPPAAAAMVQYSAYAQHVSRSTLAPARPVPAQAAVPAAGTAAATTAAPVPGIAQPTVRILQRPSST